MEKSLDVRIQYLANDLSRKCEIIEHDLMIRSDLSRELNSSLRAYQEILDFVENLFEDVIYKDEKS